MRSPPRSSRGSLSRSPPSVSRSSPRSSPRSERLSALQARHEKAFDSLIITLVDTTRVAAADTDSEDSEDGQPKYPILMSSNKMESWKSLSKYVIDTVGLPSKFVLKLSVSIDSGEGGVFAMHIRDDDSLAALKMKLKNKSARELEELYEIEIYIKESKQFKLQKKKQKVWLVQHRP